MTRPRRPRRLASFATLVLLSGLVAGTGLTPAASGSPTRAAGLGSGANAWAYGATRNLTASGLTHNGTYSLTASFGFQVVVNQSSGPDNVISLASTRTQAASFSINYCAPSCAHPTVTAHLAYRSFERLLSTTNLTSNGTVSVNGSSVPALALLNSSDTLNAATFENDTFAIHGLLATRTGAASFTESMLAHFAIGFTPGLGLVPRPLAPGESWSSSSPYGGSANWTLGYSTGRTLVNGSSAKVSGSIPGSRVFSGELFLNGSDLGSLALNGNLGTNRIAYALSGPFHLREGFLIVPASVDLFGAGTVTGAPEGNGSVGATLSASDFATGSSAHVGFVSSSIVYSTSSNDPVETAPAGGGGELSPAAESSGPVMLQGEPESIATADGQGQCLVSGTCSGASAPAPLLRPLVVAVGVVALAAVVAAVVAVRRPKAPQRAHPELYPATGRIASAAAAPSPAPVPGTPPKDAAPDPLGHLW
jgi:hypothetical protein